MRELINCHHDSVETKTWQYLAKVREGERALDRIDVPLKDKAIEILQYVAPLRCMMNNPTL